MLFLEFLYSLSDRDIVEQTQTNRIAEGCSAISKTRQEQGHLYIFSAYSCKHCSNNYGCPQPNYKRSRVFISDDYLEKLIDQTPQRLQALIQRKAIERKFGEAKKWHLIARARYRGRWPWLSRR
ncbi:MAG: transposase [Candidatus Omnitrophica bacterium]|nr:transposase [Candidatus Omnitrophota bacterium]